MLADVLDKPLPILCPSADYSWNQTELLDQSSLLKIVDSFLNNAGIPPFESTDPKHLALKTFFFLLFGILGSLNLALNAIRVEITTELTIAAGSGSSASYAVTITALLLQYARLKLKQSNASKTGYKPFHFNESKQFTKDDREIISQWALLAEKILHGTPSGIDNTVCTFGSMVEFKRGQYMKLLEIKASLRILLVNTNVSRNTKALVAKVALLHKTHMSVTDHIMDAIEECTKSSIDLINNLVQSGDNSIYDRLFELSDLNHCLLASLTVSHPKLEKIREVCFKYGLKGKLTGAGGGGYFFSFVPPTLDNKVLEKMIYELLNEGFTAAVVGLGGTGVSVD